MKIKVLGVLFISLLGLAVGCQVPQSGVKTKNIAEKTNRPVYPLKVNDDFLLYNVSQFAEEPDERELGYPFKDVTLDFSAYDKYAVQTTDPRLFNMSNVEVIDLIFIGEDEYSLPMKNPRVVSRYAGKRVKHAGIDLAGRSRDPILATFDGVVRVSKASDTYGNVIVVRHYNGLETVYSHNTRNMVKVGDEVKAGQQIAVSGQTGRASGDHLHFEVRMDGQHLNPELLFDFAAQKLQEKSLFCVKNKNRIEISQVDPFFYYLAGIDHSNTGASPFEA